MELAASAGLLLDPWQAADLEVILGERPDGKWAARQSGVIAPRQNGKDAELEAIQLAALYLWDFCRLCIFSAHEFATSSEAFLRLMVLIDGSDELRRKVRRVYRAHGAEGIELLDGTRVKYKTRTGGSGRGFSGDVVILNEAYNLHEKGISALGPTMSARKNPWLGVFSSAPLVTAESAALRRFCNRGRAGAKGLAYIEYCAPDGAGLDDPEMHQAANPAYPFRISPDAIDAERSLMTDDDFARERLGIWHDPADDSNQVIPVEDWYACETDDSKLADGVVFGLEVSEARDWSAFGAVGSSTLDAELVHGEVIDYREGTAWVPGRAKDLVDKWGAKVVVPSGSPAASLVKDLQRAGLKSSSPADPADDIVLLTPAEHAKACAQLYDAVVDGSFRHRVQPALTVAVRGAVKRLSGDGAWTFSRRRSSVDVSPLNAVAVALAAYAPIVAAKPTFAY